MPRIVRTARGELVDFDAILIKQQLAQAPMNIEVARRKQFIDSKESKAKSVRESAQAEADAAVAAYAAAEAQRLANLQAAAPTSPAEIQEALESSLIDAEAAAELATKKSKKPQAE
jgi:hypothetical protein